MDTINKVTLQGLVTTSPWMRWRSAQAARVYFWLLIADPAKPMEPADRFLCAIAPKSPTEATRLERDINARLDSPGSLGVLVKVEAHACQTALASEKSPGVIFVAESLEFVGVVTQEAVNTPPVVDVHGRAHAKGKMAAANDES